MLTKIPNIKKVEEAAKSGGEPPPPGDYVFRATQGAVKTKMVNGQPEKRFSIRWAVAVGEHKGKALFTNYDLGSVQSCSFLYNNLRVLGVTVDEEGGFDPDTIPNKYAAGKVVVNGQYTNLQRISALPSDFTPPEVEPTEDADDDIPFRQRR